MTYYYDQYGNVTANADPLRATSIAPPTCPNGQQPNWAGNGWACIAYVAPPDPSAPSLGTRITPLALTKRIGATAMAAIYAAAANNSQLQVYIAQTWGARFIDLADPLTATGLNMLVTLNILTAAQVTAILSAPVQQSELPS